MVGLVPEMVDRMPFPGPGSGPAVSGKAGNLKGQIQPGGNPFEAPRQRDYALPPLTPILASWLSAVPT